MIRHPWSRRLNEDIKASVPSPAGTNGAQGPPVQRALPCWDWLFDAAERSLDEATRAYAHQAGGAFVPHNWCLPHSFDEVSQVRRALLRGQRAPAFARALPRGVLGAVMRIA